MPVGKSLSGLQEASLDAAEVDHMIAQMVERSSRYRPAYSAVKVNGRKLYEYARAGEEVERPAASDHL